MATVSDINSLNVNKYEQVNPAAFNTAKQAGSESNSQARTRVQNQTENRSAGLSIDPDLEQKNANLTAAGNAAVQEVQKAVQKRLVESAENISKVTKKIVFEYDKRTGDAVVKFMDTKGNVVTQVPPEQYLKLKALFGDSEDFNIQEVASDPNDIKETGILLSKKV